MALGKLIAVGGAEDKGTDLELGVIQRNNLNFFELGILRQVQEAVGSKDAQIEVITTASGIPDEVGENYRQAFGKIGCNNVGHLRIRKREDTAKPEYMERLRKCDAVMFSGGNQLRLTAIYGGTEFFELLMHRYLQEGLVIAGTSAGAMAMSKTMIYQGNATDAHLKGEVKLTTGLGFVEDVIIDSHFNKRGRFPRLAQAVAANPSALGIGLGEDTGVVITNGNELHAIGSGSVIVIDGRNIRHTNIAEVEEGSPISVEGLLVHILEAGNGFDLRKRSFLVGETVEV